MFDSEYITKYIQLTKLDWTVIISGVTVAVLFMIVTIVHWLQQARRRREDELRAKNFGDPEHSELLVTPEEALVLRHMPSHGDSLFAALAHQLHGDSVGSQEHHEHTAELRARAVQQLRDHRALYWDDLLNAVRATGSRYKEYSSDEERVAAYLQDLATEGFPGGEESLKALAEALQVDVRLYVDSSSPTMVTPQQAESTKQMTLARRELEDSDSMKRTVYSSVMETSPIRGWRRAGTRVHNP